MGRYSKLVAQLLNKPQAFYKTQRLITLFTVTDIVTYPKPDESSRHPPIKFKIRFNIILQIYAYPFPSGFPIRLYNSFKSQRRR